MRSPRTFTHAVLSLAAVVLLGACSEAPTQPGIDDAPLFAKGGGGGSCTTNADFVVTNEAEFINALGSSSPGDVIALDGMVETTFGVFTPTAGITITCATPGSGMVAAPSFTPTHLLLIIAPDVTVRGLMFDATDAGQSAIRLSHNGATTFGNRAIIENNTILCAAAVCIFGTGSHGSRVEGNQVIAPGSITGIHFQGLGFLPNGDAINTSDGTRVLRNTVVDTSPSPALSGFGGIRVRDGANMVVQGNTVSGPWSNSISPNQITDSEITANHVDGAQVFGINLSFNAFKVLATPNNTFVGNHISGAEVAGIFVTLACGNVFRGNQLRDNAIGAVFDVQSGGNVFQGNHNVVDDHGDFDCDGDGVSDRNAITGPGLHASGVKLGELLRSAGGNAPAGLR